MRDPGSPGRPRDNLAYVALLEQVMAEHEGWSAKRAAEWLAENLQGKTPIFIPGLKRLQNVYSELKHVLAFRHRSLFVRPERLTAEPWLPPKREPWWVEFFANAVMTTLPSGTVVIHSPEDSVREGNRILKPSRASNNNRSNQMNPNNPSYHNNRQGSGNSKPAVDNRSNQMNPNHSPTKPAPDTGHAPKEG